MISSFKKRSEAWAGEVAQWVKQMVTTPNDLSLIVGTLKIKGETQLSPAVL